VTQICVLCATGIYGDQLNEMAWMVGEVQTALRHEHLDNNTLILLVSDNGPHIDLCSEGGNAGPFHGNTMSIQPSSDINVRIMVVCSCQVNNCLLYRREMDSV
jgi:hypothetical protein